jgi:hypothetical protein
MRRVYTIGAAWRSVSHLTTYGLIDSPTFATPFLSLLANRLDRQKNNNQNHTYCNYSIQVIPTLISDITDQKPGVIIKRDNTQSLLLRPVDHVAFVKENPSYQGPGNSRTDSY